MSIRLWGGNGLITWSGLSVLKPFLEGPGAGLGTVWEGSPDPGFGPCSSLQELMRKKENEATILRRLRIVEIRIRVMKELGCDSSLEGRIGKDGTPSDPYYWSADALADQNPELSERRNAISRIENPELVALHLPQEAVIDFPHHLGGTQGLAIASGKKTGGLFKYDFGAFRFKVHQGEEALVINTFHEVVFAILKPLKVGEWKIDPEVVFKIFSDISYDVGELKAVTKTDRILASFPTRTKKRYQNKTDS